MISGGGARTFLGTGCGLHLQPSATRSSSHGRSGSHGRSSSHGRTGSQISGHSSKSHTSGGSRSVTSSEMKRNLTSLDHSN